jgi:hypothetical protein
MTEVRRAFAVALERPGSQPTSAPATEPRRELRRTVPRGRSIPEKCCAGMTPCDALRRTAIPKSPERRGISTPDSPPAGQARKE